MAGPTTWGYQVLGFGAGKKPASGGATTTKIQVKLAVFDESSSCACTATGNTEIWEDDPNEGGAQLDPSVGDWIHGANYYCAQVTALNVTGTVDDYTDTSHDNCSDCNSWTMQCEDMGGP